MTIVEFFDARCTFCKALHPTMQALLQRDRNIRVVMKDLPILGPNSVLASRAGEVALLDERHLHTPGNECRAQKGTGLTGSDHDRVEPLFPAHGRTSSPRQNATLPVTASAPALGDG